MSFTKIDAAPGDTLFIEVECGHLPPAKMKSYLVAIKADLVEYFPDVRLILAPTGAVKFAVEKSE